MFGFLNTLFINKKLKAQLDSQENLVKDLSAQNNYLRQQVFEANKKITELLADYYDVPKSHVRLANGSKSKNKMFEVYL